MWASGGSSLSGNHRSARRCGRRPDASDRRRSRQPSGGLRLARAGRRRGPRARGLPSTWPSAPPAARLSRDRAGLKAAPAVPAEPASAAVFSAASACYSEAADDGDPVMRAAVMRNAQLVVDTVPEPVPGSGEVLVRTLACGICGSDLHALRHAPKMVDAARESGLPFTLDPARDVVMGHEFCAEVLDFGPDTQRALEPGTRVVSMPLAAGASGVQTIGYSNDYPGGYGELMVLSEFLALEVPNGLATEHAALTEPMAVGVHAGAKARFEPGGAPRVGGCGPVGLAG